MPHSIKMDKIFCTRFLVFWTFTWCCLYKVASGLERSHKRQSDEELLLSHLFRGYNPSARPVINSSETVTVSIRFSLLQIQELNVRSQVLTTTGMLILDWKDERLTWDEEVHAVNEFVINGKKIWRPEFAVINGAEGIYGNYTEFQAVIHADGKVRWEPGGVFKTMCTIDITYYPFDSQRCELIFGAWSYYTTKMNLTTNSSVINLDKFESNGEWTIEKTNVIRREFNFECCPDQRFSNVAFEIYLQRKHNFYIMNVILPSIMTSAVLLSIFFCTPSQKVHIGVASLLSFRLFLLNVADTIPRTSDHVPLLGIYLTCTMAITTLAMVATVFVLNLHSIRDKPVPRLVQRIFSYYLARVLCMYNANQTSNQPPGISHAQRKYKPIKARDGASHDFNMCNESADEQTMGLQQESPSRAKAKSKSRRQNGIINSGSPKAAKPDYSKDWIHVASVCDRLFFWLCLLFILGTTLVLFHPLTTSLLFDPPPSGSASATSSDTAAGGGDA